MQSSDTFSTYNPAINFMFFAGAVIFGMFFIHPAFLACTCFFAFAYYATIKRRKAVKLILGMIPVFVVLSALNPLFNTRGNTVLFTYFGGRPYTMEALYYGMAIAAMFVAIITWFACYNVVMTSDKFMYLFGRFIPAISMVLTMVLRFVPNYQRKLMQILSARRCIGKSGDSGCKREKAENSLTAVSALTTWAFEGGIMIADSMRSRGYGCGRRTNFSVYRFDGRDRALLMLIMALIAVVFACGAWGGMETTYTPRLYIRSISDGITLFGMVSYTILLAVPTVLNIREDITWRILRSRI
ncbi:MAG: energy-coupling factor transporter transmembrane protein EcfT [Clostridiales bacterium]|nr:energy-coupling factor transporter transmembrane protein EcfT [Clostridiales bacterium]